MTHFWDRLVKAASLALSWGVVWAVATPWRQTHQGSMRGGGPRVSQTLAPDSNVAVSGCGRFCCVVYQLSCKFTSPTNSILHCLSRSFFPICLPFRWLRALYFKSQSNSLGEEWSSGSARSGHTQKRVLQSPNCPFSGHSPQAGEGSCGSKVLRVPLSNWRSSEETVLSDSKGRHLRSSSNRWDTPWMLE